MYDVLLNNFPKVANVPEFATQAQLDLFAARVEERCVVADLIREVGRDCYHYNFPVHVIVRAKLTMVGSSSFAGHCGNEECLGHRGAYS